MVTSELARRRHAAPAGVGAFGEVRPVGIKGRVRFGEGMHSEEPAAFPRRREVQE
jgi:hypothetical protein